MARVIFIFFFLVQFISPLKAQKFSLGFQYARKYTRFQLKENLIIGDSIYLRFNKFELNPSLTWLVPMPYAQYEFKNKAKLFTDFNFNQHIASIVAIKESPKAIQDSEAKLKYKTLRLSFEMPVYISGERALGINTGLSITHVNKNIAVVKGFGLNGLNNNVSPEKVRENVANQLNSIGNFLSANIGMSYAVASRFNLYYNLSFSLTELGHKSYFIDKLYNHQFGLRYELCRKTIATNQYTKKYLSVTKTNHKKNFSIGLNLNYDLSTKINASGFQSYYFNGTDGNGDNFAFNELLNSAPVIKTYPEIGLSFFKYIQSNQFSIRTNINWQFMDVIYKNAIAQSSNGEYIGKDEQNGESKLTITEGIDYTFGKNWKCKPFISPSCGINIFYYLGYLGNETKHTIDYDGFNPAAFTYDIQAGIQYKNFRLGAKYSKISGQINNFGDYKLKDFSQFKIFLNLNIFTKNHNEKI